MTRMLRQIAGLPLVLLAQAYLRVFGRPGMQVVNNKILHLALRARGYDNFEGADASGETCFIRMLALREPKLCVDVGANKGGYTRQLLELTPAKVIAFEPLPKACDSLRQLQARFPERLVCINKGVGEKNGILDLHFGAEDSEHASFSVDVKQVDYVGAANVRSMSVAVTTLDDFFARQIGEAPGATEIDLLKIDTEGFEHDVLLGARKTLEVLRPKFIQIECNWHQLFRRQSLFTLAALLPGYRAYQLLPYGFGLAARNPKEPDSNIYRFSNFVFVRSDISV